MNFRKLRLGAIALIVGLVVSGLAATGAQAVTSFFQGFETNTTGWNDNGGTITRVAVTEGVVSVRRDGNEVRVTPGHVWPEKCAAGAPAAASAAGPSPRVRIRGGLTHSKGMHVTAPAVAEAPAEAPAPVETPPEAPPLSKSELAAQNDMFASAVRAKRHGHASLAVRILERFSREYPNSPLTESAAAQRMKLLAVIDSVAARRAATDYLSRYPTGFARADAQQLLGEP